LTRFKASGPAAAAEATPAGSAHIRMHASHFVVDLICSMSEHERDRRFLRP